MLAVRASITICSLAACLPAFAQQFAAEIDTKVYNDRMMEVEGPVKLSSFNRKVNGIDFVATAEVPKLEALYNVQKWSVSLGQYVPWFSGTRLQVEHYRNKSDFIVRSAWRSIVVTKGINELSQLSQVKCMSRQIGELNQFLVSPADREFVRRMKVDRVEANLIDNSGGLKKDRVLRRKFSIYDDPILRVEPVLNSKNECKVVTSEEMRLQISEWKKNMARPGMRGAVAEMIQNRNAVLSAIGSPQPTSNPAVRDSGGAKVDKFLELTQIVSEDRSTPSVEQSSTARE